MPRSTALAWTASTSGTSTEMPGAAMSLFPMIVTWAERLVGDATERLLTSFYATGTPDSSACHDVPLAVRPTLRLPVLARTAVGLGAGAVAAALGWGAIQLRRRMLVT